MDKGCSISGCLPLIPFIIIGLIVGLIVSIGSGIILGVVFITYRIIKLIENLKKNGKFNKRNV